MTNEAPLNAPCGLRAGAAGVVVTRVVPIFTDAMVLPDVKPTPEKSMVAPGAALVICVLEVLVSVTPGLNVKAEFTVTDWSVSSKVYEPCGKLEGRLHT